MTEKAFPDITQASLEEAINMLMLDIVKDSDLEILKQLQAEYNYRLQIIAQGFYTLANP